MNEKWTWILMLSVIQSPTSNSWGFKVPLSLAHRYSSHFSLHHILHDNLWSVQHYFFFLSLKKNTFYSPLHCELSKHWSIWFKGKTKSKHRRPNYALCGKELCECGLKKWVESQEENDVDFLEQTEEKSRSNFSTSQLCHCPFKALTVGVWWSRSKAMDTEVTIW